MNKTPTATRKTPTAAQLKEMSKTCCHANVIDLGDCRVCTTCTAVLW